ncbi:MAG TPA: hypothetical protein VK015_07180, partial [Microbacterium sp.]|nr:hypothetical protein [Microbacterium sp.]
MAVLDVNLGDGNGVALGLELQRKDPRIAIMLLSSNDVMGLFLSVQDEGSEPWSYLSERSSFARDVLIGAIAAAADGEVVIDPTLVRRSQPRAGTEVAGLTPAQFGVLRLVAEGPVERGRRRAPAHHRAVGREPPAVDLPTLRQWGADLDELREDRERSLSHSLFPSGADLGAHDAIRVLLDRLPTSVCTSI